MKHLKTTLMAAFAAASLLAVVACGDDDSDDNGGSAMGGSDSGGTGSSATPRGPDGMPTLGTQIDRTGRPAISTATVAAFSGDDAAKGTRKDAYNAAGPPEWTSFKDDIKGSLAILDSLDTDCGNQLVADMGDSRYDFLATVLADDQLYVHSERSECGVYLGLEAEIVGAVPEGDGKCGGRTPTDDVIDRSYSVLAAGVLAGVGDTIDSDDGGANASTFPFLGAPSN